VSDAPDQLILPNAPSGSSAFVLERERPSRAWFLLFIAALLSTVAYLRASPRAGNLQDARCPDLALDPELSGAVGRAFYLLALTMIGLVLCLTLVAGPASSLFTGPAERGAPVGLIIAVLLAAVLPVLLLVRAAVLTRAIHKYARTPKCEHGTLFRRLSALPWLIALGYAAVLASVLTPGQWLQGLFFTYRSQEYGSGVCPSLPLLLLYGAFGVWSYVQLERVIFSDERYELLPSLHDGRDNPIQTCKTQLDKSLATPFPRAILFGAGLPVLLLVSLVGWRNMRSLEGIPYDALFILSTAILTALLALAAARFCSSWRLLLRILELIEQHPIREAFDHLPPDYSWSPIWQQSPRKRSYAALSRAMECARELRRMGVRFPINANAPRGFEDLAADLLDYAGKGKRAPAALRDALQQSLLDMSEHMIAKLRPEYWSRGGSQTLKEMETEEDTKDALKKTKKEVSRDKVNLLFQEFVAMRFLAYIRYVMLQLRNLMTFIGFGFVLLVLALGSYPFQSPHVIAVFLGLLLIGLGGPVVWAFMEMGRDATLSRITNTKAGSLDMEFYLRTASFVALPLLALVASHFPSAGQYISSWIQPALKALH